MHRERPLHGADALFGWALGAEQRAVDVSAPSPVVEAEL